MFTGLVTAVGTVRAAEGDRATGIDLEIAAPYRGLAMGESIAVNGACLTVVARGRGWFRVRAVPTTLARTLLGQFAPGDRVNLERALRAGDRLGGHLVQGHVDGVGRVVATRRRGDARIVDVAVPTAVARVSIPLGSIAVDGVSLTVNAVPRRGIIRLSLIPHTLDHTTLGALTTGDRVQLEGDLIGKYVQQLLRPRQPRARGR